MRLLIALMVVVMTVEAQDKICQDNSCQKSRAQKKALLQEASKRSADFEQILREAEGKPKHDLIADWFIKNWEEYETSCARDTILVEGSLVPVGWPPEMMWIRGHKHSAFENDGCQTENRWVKRSACTLDGFIDYLKRRKK